MGREPGDLAERRVYADLVDGLVDARDDPASARFDAELDAAVADGEISAATARRLRFWQRASVRALADHTRAVLPTCLSALEASRREAAERTEQLAETLGPRDARAPSLPASAPMAPRATTLATGQAPPIVATLVTAPPAHPRSQEPR